MEEVLFRFVIVWILLYVILFFIQLYRYERNNWSWYGFKNNGMLTITYAVLCVGMIIVIAAILMVLGYLMLHPMVK